jgi:hypothetical protein
MSLGGFLANHSAMPGISGSNGPGTEKLRTPARTLPRISSAAPPGDFRVLRREGSCRVSILWFLPGNGVVALKFPIPNGRIRLPGHPGVEQCNDTVCETPLSYQARTCFGSACEGNKAPESRIGDAITSGFDVTRQSIFERRVSGSRNDQVVPTLKLIQRRLVEKGLAGN